MQQHLTTSKKGIQLIKNSEGVRFFPYKCSAGVLTIGIGHAIKKGENFKYPLTLAAVEDMLRKDLAIAEACINNNVKYQLNQNQFDALVSFIFNNGTGAFLESTMLKLLNNKKFSEAANQFQRWNKVTNPTTGKLQESAGLTTRRKAEEKLFSQAIIKPVPETP